MKTRIGSILLLASLARASPAPIEVNSHRGQEIYESQACPACHKTGGDPFKPGPNLMRRLDRGFTAAGLASRIWNHAPAIWEQASKSANPGHKMTEADVGDLFGFFYSVRFFESLGEAGRGKVVFKQKRCDRCHALETGGGPGNPVKQWAGLVDPVDMVQRMWTHAQDVVTALDSRDVEWRELSAQDLTDLLVYLQNIPATRPAKFNFELPVGENGGDLIRERGCVECHQGSSALEKTMWRRTLTEAAVAMWNHAPKIPGKVPHIPVSEMREIISYAWSHDFFTPRGNAQLGRKAFERKCESCHPVSSLNTTIRARTTDFTAMAMVSAVWAHDSKPFQERASRGQGWPPLSEIEMANVIAYLNSLRQ